MNLVPVMGHMQSGHCSFSTKYDLGVTRAKLPYQPAEARRLFGSGMIGAINNEITGTRLHRLEETGDMVVVWMNETESHIRENRLTWDIPDNFFKSPKLHSREEFSGKLARFG
jgi:hypothetical protein